MCQRHQVFIIARILTAQGEKHYRCVGALHHQWCYGNLSFLGAHRFLTLIKQTDTKCRDHWRRTSSDSG